MTYPPLTSRVDDPIAQHQPTSATDKVSAAELLDDIGVRISAFRADEADCEVRTESRLLDFLERLSEGKGLRVCHGKCGLRVRRTSSEEMSGRAVVVEQRWWAGALGDKEYWLVVYCL